MISTASTNSAVGERRNDMLCTITIRAVLTNCDKSTRDALHDAMIASPTFTAELVITQKNAVRAQLCWQQDVFVESLQQAALDAGVSLAVFQSRWPGIEQCSCLIESGPRIDAMS
jgi:hypothetical protein